MQIIDLELSHFNFFCPATGQQIIGEEQPCNDAVPSLMGYWVDLAFDDPVLNDQAFADAWEAFEKQDDFYDKYDWPTDALEDFLQKYPENNWVVYKITTRGMACGPTSSTVWFVIDMDTVVEEV